MKALLRSSYMMLLSFISCDIHARIATGCDLQFGIRSEIPREDNDVIAKIGRRWNKKSFISSINDRASERLGKSIVGVVREYVNIEADGSRIPAVSNHAELNIELAQTEVVQRWKQIGSDVSHQLGKARLRVKRKVERGPGSVRKSLIKTTIVAP